MITRKSTNLDIHRTESWLVVVPGNHPWLSRARLFKSKLERVRQERKPATSQVVDLVIALLLFFPESKVLLEKLNDGLSITEVILLELIDLVEGLLEGTVGKLASLRVILQDLVVEDGEVKSKSELNGVASGKINRVSFFIGTLCLLLDILEGSLLGVLGDVAVVITNHLDEESLGLISAFSLEDTVVDHVDDLLAISLELCLDLGLVGEKSSVEFGILGVLLDGGDCAASSAFA